ncbi:MAG: hypothetical protein LBB80_00275 [Treponema sp.]|jgi:hypothetical protein|nr:hypothetical protein [Treponema sp.]
MFGVGMAGSNRNLGVYGDVSDLSARGAIHFIKVHTGEFMYGGVFGDHSTEIYSADFLGQQTDVSLP